MRRPLLLAINGVRLLLILMCELQLLFLEVRLRVPVYIFFKILRVQVQISLHQYIYYNEIQGRTSLKQGSRNDDGKHDERVRWRVWGGG